MLVITPYMRKVTHTHTHEHTYFVSRSVLRRRAQSRHRRACEKSNRHYPLPIQKKKREITNCQQPDFQQQNFALESQQQRARAVEKAFSK